MWQCAVAHTVDLRDGDGAAALRAPTKQASRRIDANALDTVAVRGYPLLIQQVGSLARRATGDHAPFG